MLIDLMINLIKDSFLFTDWHLFIINWFRTAIQMTIPQTGKQCLERQMMLPLRYKGSSFPRKSNFVVRINVVDAR